MASFCLASASLGALRPVNSKAAPLRARNARLSVRAGAINPDIKKDEPKVVDTVKCSDVKGKSVMCRCWKSKNFPMCDGSHVQHNKDNDDNVGPL
eukprot:CAMPEP_0168607912 /NCGR_PEP_ID=MMETSP0449_2-20121227/334_1 /TAXON_ID=1082188 /ORGANISM="Strombidium rassoulzadegani, Strain ras09" /LENGTH=94 /DNA_ID=CAMNT_0008647837 /DNA_START=35 /DNA_END=315 /DNA_ORIENTATION=-